MNLSAVHEHCKLTGYSVDSSKTKVLATERGVSKTKTSKTKTLRP